MNAPDRLLQAIKTISFELDGRTVQAAEGETILEVADREGLPIPRLCYMPGYRPDGNCRSCMVEIDGERVLAPSCCRTPSAGMKVRATSERAVKSQKMVLEMLLSDMPPQGHKWIGDDATRQHGELSDWSARMGVNVRPELAAITREQPPCDLSHPAMAVNLDACIQCNRCVRACREEQVNDVIGYAMRGEHSKIVF